MTLKYAATLNNFQDFLHVTKECKLQTHRGFQEYGNPINGQQKEEKDKQTHLRIWKFTCAHAGLQRERERVEAEAKAKAKSTKPSFPSVILRPLFLFMLSMVYSTGEALIRIDHLKSIN